MQTFSRARYGWFFAVLVAGASLLQAGCITFEQQTLEYQYDRSTDRLYLHSTFTGVFGDGVEPLPTWSPTIGLSSYEQNQLLNAAQGETAFFFDNWLLGFDVNELKEVIDDELAAPSKDTPSSRAMADARRLLVTSATVSTGPFFLDERGRLSAVQRVTIRRITPLLKAFNAALALKAAADLKAGTTGDPGYRMMIAAAACGLPLLSLEGNLITIHWGTDNETEARVSNAAFIEAGARFTFEHGIASIAFGRVDSVREKFIVRVADGYVANAIPFVRAHIGIAGQFDRLADVDRFFPPTPRSR